MKNKAIAAIVVVVVVIVIAASLTVILMKPSTSDSSKMFTPNVVSAQDMGKDLGGTWAQKMGTSGVVSSYSSFESFLNTSTGLASGYSFAPSAFYSHITIVPALYGAVGSSVPSMASLGSSEQFPVSSFELALFAPSKLGFASVGYLQFTNTSALNSIFYSAFSNLTNASSKDSMLYKGTYDGDNFIYAWNSTDVGQGSDMHAYNLSVLLGLDAPYLIYIFYMVTGNDTLSSFESLFSTQISMVASVSSSFISSFVSTSDLNSTLKSDYVQEIAAKVSISNASELLGTFYSLEGYDGYSIGGSSSVLINQTIGNLTGLGMSAYLGNSSGNMSAVAIGYATFLNDNASLEIFTLLEAYTGSVNSQSQLHVVTVDGYNALVFNITVSMNGQTFSEGFIVVDYKNALVSALVIGSLSLTPGQLETIVGDQMTLVP